MKQLRILCLLACAGAMAGVARAGELKVGDPAPAMTVAKWVKGKPVEKFEVGKKYVVEFWATWCGPCKESIPHLTEMAKKYKDITFTGISIWEKQGNQEVDYGAKVAAFVKEMGSKMDYNVGYEDFDKAPMAKNWMAAAGQEGIPAAFLIIDQKVAWIGHPMMMDSVLEKVANGTFDPKAEMMDQQAKEDEARKQQEMLKPVLEAAQAGNFEKAVAELDKVISEKPAMEKNLAMFRFNLLLEADEKAANAYGVKLSEGIYKDDAIMLNQIAWTMVDDETPIKVRDYDGAVKIAERANELSKGENAMILDTMALGYFKQKKVDLAITTQEKAISKIEKTEGMTDEIRKDIKSRLDQFKKAKAGGGGS